MADCFQFAINALGLASNAQSPPMPDHAMREVDPLVTRDHSHQVLLNLAGFVLGSKFEASGNAIDMGVHNHAFSFPKPGAQDDIGSFASRPRYGEKLLHLIRNFPAKLVDDLLRRTHE